MQQRRSVVFGGNALDPIYSEITRALADRGFFLEHYQRAAVLRRVHRRMQALSLPALDDYATFLSSSASEASELIREVSRPQGLLFRDITVIEALAAFLPERFRDLQRPQIWVPACGSGEEVYATAMIVDAVLGAAGMRREYVVYGTDTDVDALRAAQSGIFHAGAAERVPAHLSEFHLGMVGGALQVVSDLKQRCVFLAHDVAESPPFFDIDLVICRNLLPHLQAALQRHLLERIASSLKPKGLLFLGRMETPIEYPDLFETPPPAPGLYERVDPDSAMATEIEQTAPRRIENLHQALFRSIPVPLMLLDKNLAFVEANPAAVMLLGERAAEILGHEITDWVEETDHARLLEACQALTPERSMHLDLTLRDGRAVELVLGRVTGHPGRILVQTLTDGDARLRSRLAEATRRLDVLLRYVDDAVILVDSAELIVEFNAEAQRLTGWARNEAIDQPLQKVLKLDNVAKDMTETPIEFDSGVPHTLSENTFLTHIAGRRCGVAVRSVPIPNAGGAVIVIEDISERALLREELAYRASHDTITGLINRDEFEARARAALAAGRQGNTTTVLAFIDIDQFRIINDTLGHSAGDELLHDLAIELRAQLGGNDSLARLGGDEFGVLLGDCDADIARPVVEALLDAVRRFRFHWSGRSHALTISIGATVIGKSTESVAQAMSEADTACFTAKDAGRDRAHFAGDNAELSERYTEMSLAGQLGRALDENRFLLYFEDVIPVDKPDRVVYRELLIRVREESGAIVPPGAYIHAAERFFMMTTVDRWVVRNALRDIATLPPDGIIYGINLSGQSLSDEKFLDYVLGEIESSKVDPQRVCFEITEKAAVLRLGEAVRFVNRLSDRGCRFALDDFGVGMASFAYLRNFHVDFLKIDGSLICSMGASRADRGMVDMINRLGHELGLRTIAEHVEGRESFEALKVLGVDWAQGRGIGIGRPFSDLVTSSS